MKQPKKKILIADSSQKILRLLKQYKGAKHFQIDTALTGPECIKKLKASEPDLIVLDFMLPEIHAIEILKKIKDGPLMGKMGVIITSYNGMVQNYHSAIKLGAHYFLEKPFTPALLFKKIELFFEGKLHPDSFPERASGKEYNYICDKGAKSSYIKFWGSRGSNPVSGPEYIRFGGNTCCLEVRHGDDVIIIDAGTGIRGLGHVIQQLGKKNCDILLSHTHWDHLLGFPFFSPIYHPENEIFIWAPVGFEKSTKELFTDMLAYAYFPVGLEDIQAKISFKDLRDRQSIRFGSIEIATHYAYHPGATLCFRIKIGHTTFGYITDNEFLMGFHGHPSTLPKKTSLLAPYEDMIEFFKGCDFLVHEAQYTPQEYTKRVGWGHSSISNASLFLKYTGIKQWIVTHHDPNHCDETLLEKQQLHIKIMKEIGHACQIQFAYDGMMLPIC